MDEVIGQGLGQGPEIVSVMGREDQWDVDHLHPDADHLLRHQEGGHQEADDGPSRPRVELLRLVRYRPEEDLGRLNKSNMIVPSFGTSTRFPSMYHLDPTSRTTPLCITLRHRRSVGKKL